MLNIPLCKHRDQKMRQVVALKRFKKTMENHYNCQGQKVVAFGCRRWSFTRGSNCNALTGKILVFWIGSCLREVVAHGVSTVLLLLYYYCCSTENNSYYSFLCYNT